MTHRFRFTCTRLLPACALAALLAGPPGFAPSANAADITYPGSSLDKSPLWQAINDCLFPAGSLSDNKVTIKSAVFKADKRSGCLFIVKNAVFRAGGRPTLYAASFVAANVPVRYARY